MHGFCINAVIEPNLNDILFEHTLDHGDGNRLKGRGGEDFREGTPNYSTPNWYVVVGSAGDHSTDMQEINQNTGAVNKGALGTKTLVDVENAVGNKTLERWPKSGYPNPHHQASKSDI